MLSQKIIFLSTYPPRECGIATFTKDLSDAVQKKFGKCIVPKVVAMEDTPSNFRVYPNKVFFKIDKDEISSYKKAAEKINSMKNSPILNIQHEFGIFGGDYGANILKLMELTNKKIITTFHTVLSNPEEEMNDTVRLLSEKSNKIVVMTDIAKSILVSDYSITPEKIEVIPHGVPNVNLNYSKEKIKKKYGLVGKKLLFTFGLLSRGKAIEYVIKAMPKIIQKYPDVVYLVVGETHPKVREEEGESYRLELKGLAKKRGVENSVKFLDKYLSLAEIMECLKMADIYLAPSLDPRQICSGTVSYAMAAGKAIISSPNKYNSEVLSDERGIMLSKSTASGFSKNIIKLLSDDPFKTQIEKNAFSYSRRMVWPNVSRHYYNVFSELSGFDSTFVSRLPRINFKHLYNLTDDFGIFQFADYSSPLKESGYTLDDNARALSVALKSYELNKSPKMLKAAETYFNFIEHCHTSDGYFHNVVDENREFADDRGSEDSFGRAVHSLGNVLRSNLPDDFKIRAKKILQSSIGNGINVESPRAQANSLIGLVRAKHIIESSSEKIDHFVDSLVSKFDSNSDDEWKWFEKYLTYGNSIIPEALFEATGHDKTGRADQVASKSMNFLTKTHFIDGRLVPIGQDGWFEQGKERAVYDQQPIEAAGMTTAYLKAYNFTKDNYYLKSAMDSFEWFLGRNSINQMIYDDSTGGCFDGLTPTGVNLNQGAESTVCYLNARLSIQKIYRC